MTRSWQMNSLNKEIIFSDSIAKGYGLSRISIESVQRGIDRHRESITKFVLAALALLFTIYLLSLSIQYNDSDLWYHLTGGRYLLTEGALYNPYVNSYLSPPAPFTNYFWGFQLSMYLIWSAAGEIGLIVVKAICFLIAGYFVARIVVGDQRLHHASFLQLLVIAAVLGILASRGFSLRPHVLSYVFIPVFIYILTYRQGLFWLLPLLTIAWANLHGVEWVVGGLICGAFFLQRVCDYWFSNERDITTLKPALWIVACLPALLVNPHHVGLLATPFLHDAGLKGFIGELAPFTFKATIDLNNGISPNSLIVFLIALGLASFISCARHFRQHIAVLVLAAGGVILLLTAKRFIWEWMLLLIPLIAAGMNYWPRPKLNLQTTAVLIAVLILLPVYFWPTVRIGWQHYPYHKHSLPFGTTEFIASHQITGRYAIAPSYAGYTEFVLSPDILVHMDMQFPPFTSTNFHEISTAMLTATGLTTYINKYRPDLVGAMKSNKHFPVDTAVTLGYVPVFFDQRVVLFIDANKHQEIATRYGLKVINPFSEDTVRRDQIDAGILELERMIDAVDTPDVKLTLTGFLLETGSTTRALDLATQLMADNPYDIAHQYFYARAEHLSGDYAAAAAAYEQALISAEDPLPMHRYAAECYFLLGQPENAYRHFRKAIFPYRDAAPNMLHYYQYAIAAIAMGDEDTARRLLAMIGQHDPQSEVAAKAAELLADMGD